MGIALSVLIPLSRLLIILIVWEGQEASVAGRVMAIRGHGKASFVVLADKEGQIQIYVRMDEVGEEQYDIFRLWDIG